LLTKLCDDPTAWLSELVNYRECIEISLRELEKVVLDKNIIEI